MKKAPATGQGLGRVRNMDTLFLIICYVLVIGSWSLLWSIYTGDPLYIWHRQIKFVKKIYNHFYENWKNYK